VISNPNCSFLSVDEKMSRPSKTHLAVLADYRTLCELTERLCWLDCRVVGEVSMAFLRQATKSGRSDLDDQLDRRLLKGVKEPFYAGLDSLWQSGGTSSIVLVGASTRDSDKTQELPHCRIKGLDLALAIYLPLEGSSPTWAKLWIHSHLLCEWRRTQSGWEEVRSPGEDLRKALSKERDPPESVDLRRELHDQKNETLRVFDSQRQTAYSRPYDRASTIEWRGKQYQRCQLVDPCLPLVAFYAPVRMEFDRHVDFCVEGALLPCDLRDDLSNMRLAFKVRNPACKSGHELMQVRHLLCVPLFSVSSQPIDSKDEILSNTGSGFLIHQLDTRGDLSSTL
jgi:hypothetical protein